MAFEFGACAVLTVLCTQRMRTVQQDQTCPSVVEPGKPAWREVVRNFGEGILHADGTINREKLGSLVFNDDSKRHTLNSCTHHYIGRAVLWELAKHFIKGIYIYDLIVYLICICVTDTF